MPADETTAQRAARLRAEGVAMCGPLPPTDADLDALEELHQFLSERTANDDLRRPDCWPWGPLTDDERATMREDHARARARSRAATEDVLDA